MEHAGGTEPPRNSAPSHGRGRAPRGGARARRPLSVRTPRHGVARGGTLMRNSRPSRRQFLKTTAAAATGVLAGPFVSTSRAAGKLAIAMNDHFVPGHNDVSRKLIEDWAKANKVEVTIDYLPPAG